MKTFGDALEALKAGNCVARLGWNGKNMYLQLKKGLTNLSPQNGLVGGVRADLFEHDEFAAPTVEDMDEPRSIYPCIQMIAANGMVVNGWLASQTDMLAEDWQIVAEDWQIVCPHQSAQSS